MKIKGTQQPIAKPEKKLIKYQQPIGNNQKVNVYRQGAKVETSIFTKNPNSGLIHREDKDFLGNTYRSLDFYNDLDKEETHYYNQYGFPISEKEFKNMDE